MVLHKYYCYTLDTSNIRKIVDSIKRLLEYYYSEDNNESNIFLLAKYPFLNNTTIRVNAITKDNLKKDLGKNKLYGSMMKKVNNNDVVETTIRSGTGLAPYNTQDRENLDGIFISDDNEPTPAVYLLFNDSSNISGDYHYPGINLPRRDFVFAIHIDEIRNTLWFTKLSGNILLNNDYLSNFSKKRKWLVLRNINETDRYYSHPTLEEFDEIGREAAAACEKEAQILAVEKAGLSDRAAFATRNTKDSMRAVHADGEESSNRGQEETLMVKPSPSNVSQSKKRKRWVRSSKPSKFKPVDVYDNLGGSSHRNKKSFKLAKRKPRKTRRHRRTTRKTI
jgi:hypothetical protein